MNESHTNDEFLFDRLVDGELPSEERRQLLASLDDRPGGWRQCALAFLEAQSWRTDLGQVVKEANAAAPQLRSLSDAAKADRFARRRALGWLAIAAGLLVSFNLGLAWHGDAGGPPAGGNVGSGSSLANVAGGAEKGAPDAVGSNDSLLANEAARGPNDALTFWVRNDAGSAQRVHVPLVDASTLDRQFGVKFRPGLPAAVREHLERNGYNVQSTHRYAPLLLDNGHSLVVPVEDTHIVPISPVVY